MEHDVADHGVRSTCFGRGMRDQWSADHGCGGHDQRTMFGTVNNPKNEGLSDLSLREFATFTPLLILAVWIGLYPKPFIDRLDTSVDRVMARVNSTYAPLNAGATDEGEPGEADLLAQIDGETTGDGVDRLVLLPVRGGSR